MVERCCVAVNAHVELTLTSARAESSAGPAAGRAVTTDDDVLGAAAEPDATGVAAAGVEAEPFGEPPEKKPVEAPGGGAEPFGGPLEKWPSVKWPTTAGLLAGAAPEEAAGSACCLAMSAAYMSRCLAAGSWFLPPSLGAGSLLAGTTAGGGATGA